MLDYAVIERCVQFRMHGLINGSHAYCVRRHAARLQMLAMFVLQPYQNASETVDPYVTAQSARNSGVVRLGCTRKSASAPRIAGK